MSKATDPMAVILKVAKEHIKCEGTHVYRVTCPIHENGNESRPSLDAKYDSKTKNVLLHCKVCDEKESYPDFLKAWKLRPADLKPAVQRHEVAAYPYHDENRKLLYEKVRYEPKDFRYRRPNGALGIKGIPKTLYRLPGLLADLSDTVYIVEGEKDVDTLTDRGRTATTAGGLNDWRSEFNQYFIERDVVIIADNHPKGVACANRIAAELLPTAASVKVIDKLPVKAKGDITDFFDQNGTIEDFDRIVFKATVLTEAPVVENTTATSKDTIHCTDAGNAERFANAYNDKLRYNASTKKWMYQDGTRWNRDRGGTYAERCYRELTKKLWRDAGNCDDVAIRPSLLTHAKRSETAGAMTACLKYAQSHSKLTVWEEDFDKDPYLFNVMDGVVDLKTGELRPHDPTDMITQLAPVYYHYRGRPTTAMWMKCLRKWHNGDEDAIDYLQQLAGMCLTGDTSSRCFPIFHGKGKNGKNTFLETIMFMMGDYAGTAPPSLLRESRNEEHPTEVAGLKGKRLIVASETKIGMKLKTSLVKSMTGDKQMTARFMRGDFFNFTPTHKVVLMTQNLPVIDETTDAIWDRLHVQKWGVRIPLDEQDNHLDEKLQREWTGILRWAIAGCLKWQEAGTLVPTEAILQQIEEYRNEQNPLKSFVENMCILGDDQFVSVAEMWSVYGAWQDEQSHTRIVTAREFNLSLEALGPNRKSKWVDGKNDKYWVGIGLNPKG